MIHPTQMANANSREAKKIKIPATIMAANFEPIKNRIVTASVIINPSRAAKILGALSIALFPSFKALVNQ